MKLHRLELEGFGPFRERQSVDFDAFADDGIFLISGRTGSGKSSVLDGVCYALYGAVPRYEGAEKRLRSDHCAPDDPTEVRLEFTAEGERWRVARSPEYERPKRRGGGLTKEPHQALLERLDGEQWVGVAARPVDVAARLDEILGLSQQQFLQVILLAQNRFAKFLLARNDERQALLRTLFATRTYEQYAEELETRRKDAERALASEGEGVRMLIEEGERTVGAAGLAGGDDSAGGADPGEGAAADGGAAVSGSPADPADPGYPARIAALVRAVERAEYRVDTLARERAEADQAHTAAVEAETAARALRRSQEERAAARDVWARLETAAPLIDADRAARALADAAETLRAALDGVDRAHAADRAAADAEHVALTRWAALGEDAVTAEARTLRDDELTATIAACDAAAAAEAELAALETARARARERAAAMERELVELDARRAPLPKLLTQLDEQLAALAPAPATRDSARASLADLDRRLDAAREAESLAGAVRTAEQEAVRRGTEMQAAVGRFTALLQRRLDGAANELAASLVEGEPCPVCGGIDHPHPASRGVNPTRVDPTSTDPVTEAELDQAEDDKNAAVEADRAAADAARAAREALAVVAARAGGDDVPTLEGARLAAAALLDKAEAAVSTAGRLGSDRAQLISLADDAATEHARLLADIARVRQDAAVDDERAAASARAVDAARGDFGSVADRRADAERRRAAVRALAEASAERAVRAQVRADADADLDVRLTASSFSDAAHARAQLRSAAERSGLDARIRDHDAAVRSAKQRLLELELELVDAPEELVDLDGPAADVARTRERFTAAVTALAEAASIADRLRDLAQRADAGAHGITELAARHAVIARLAHTVAGRAPNTHRMTLETFVLAAELEEIVAAANLRLDEMSAGRYRLLHSDALAARGAASGLGLEVLDAFTGQPRPPQSLSGGESFLASLALALGLAEVVTARAGGLRLDTLFIDEGFGSLDEETLDLAMRTLDELRQGGRTVGVISHVAAMKEQVPAQLSVRATPQGPSILRQGAALGVRS